MRNDHWCCHLEDHDAEILLSLICCCFFLVKSLRVWKELCHLSELIYYDENSIKTLWRQKICNNIQRDGPIFRFTSSQSSRSRRFKRCEGWGDTEIERMRTLGGRGEPSTLVKAYRPFRKCMTCVSFPSSVVVKQLLHDKKSSSNIIKWHLWTYKPYTSNVMYKPLG